MVGVALVVAASIDRVQPAVKRDLFEGKRALWREVFNESWTPMDLYLPCGQGVHDDFGFTWGVTAADEPFTFDGFIVLAHVDLDGLPEDGMLAAHDQAFEQASLVAGWLTGPAGTTACTAIVGSFGAGDAIQIIEPLSDEQVVMLEDQQSRTLPSINCLDATGNPISDPVLDTCNTLALLAYNRDRACLRTASGLGAVIVVGLNGGCWLGATLGGGIAYPVCIALLAPSSIYAGCMLAQWQWLDYDYNYALNCCCALAQCRANGGGAGCPGIGVCMQTRFCGEAICLP